MTLPVREMVLYKHGVGFFVRQGAVGGDSLTLHFREEEINDALKSLIVFDQAGGQVLGLHYQTPMDKAARLSSSSIRLGESASLKDLIKNLRGRRVVLTVALGDSTESFSGRMIGWEESTFGNQMMGQRYLTTSSVGILLDDGVARFFDVKDVRGIGVEDALAVHDLSYFLDTSLSEDVRRSVHVRLTEGDHDLVVYYVAPSPTWRVSYRVVAEINPEGQSGKALVQGWGLFDNRFEEDLEDVKVTLVAGQPISFIYDLYASRIPKRPVVQEEARTVQGPIEFVASADMDISEDADAPAWLMETIPSGRARSAPAAVAMSASPRPAAPPPSRKAVASAASPAAETKDAAEFFQYIVTAPVSVKRGESALVPILSVDVEYERELLYNAAKLPDYPVVALRFINRSGLTFERGPATIVEDGDYKGECIVPFTKDGNGVYLPFAVERGVKVTERHDTTTITERLGIADAMLVFEQYMVNETLYIIENTTAKPVLVLVELPIETGWELFETRVPDTETATDRRWRVSVPARGQAEFKVRLRRRTYRREEVRRLDMRNLHEYLRQQWLDKALFDRLEPILQARAQIDAALERIKTLEKERDSLYKQQEQLRANITTLQTSGDEATALRKRMLDQLATSQRRLEVMGSEIEALKGQIEQSEANMNRLIAQL